MPAGGKEIAQNCAKVIALTSPTPLRGAESPEQTSRTQRSVSELQSWEIS